MKSNEEKKEFYERVSAILGIPHEYHDPLRRTRWNNRALGNGRYSGFGLVQCFGSSVRVVSKKGTRVFKDYESVYDYLKTFVDYAS